jgi:hypothetical protein
MPGIEGFTGYGGLAPHSGSIAQILDLQGVIAPHDGKAYRESLLYGISGGAVFAYFYFAYENQDPQVNLLTRNTFGEYGWDSICERLGISRDVIKSTSPEKAEAKLIELLEEGRAPAVWADVFTLGYEYSDLGEDMWAMQPVVVGRISRTGIRRRRRSRVRRPKSGGPPLPGRNLPESQGPDSKRPISDDHPGSPGPRATA